MRKTDSTNHLTEIFDGQTQNKSSNFSYKYSIDKYKLGRIHNPPQHYSKSF